MNATQLLAILESFQTYNGLKKEMHDIFKNGELDSVKDKKDIDYINANIKEYSQEIDYYQMRFNEKCNFEVDLDKVDFFDLINTLKEIKSEQSSLDGMSDSWRSGNACDMASNDPSLQYQQENLIEALWNDFEKNYKSNN